MTDRDRELLADLLLRWEELHERGQDVPASELAKDHPGLIDELARRIQVLKKISWIDKQIDDDPPPDDRPDDPPDALKTLAGRYRLDELIAEGGFAKVFRAYDTELERTVAIKVPKASQVESKEAFQAEARRVAGLKHEGIVPVFDVGLDGDTCFIVTEFVEGGSLAERMTKEDIGLTKAVAWAAEIGDALEYAHRRGVIHLDIKPANILLDDRGRARLADFGIARSAGRTGQFTPSLGTLRYMSPEQLEGTPTDHRSDIYSLAVVLYEVLNGRTPYSTSEPHTLRTKIVLGQKASWSNDFPLALRQAVDKALSRDPSQRHSSAAEFITEIRRAALPKTPRRNLVWLGGLITFGALVGSALSTKHWLAEPLSQVKQIPGHLLISGIGSQKTLQGSLPSSWIKKDVFAEIRGAGVAEFPRLPISAFVLELDLEMRNPLGRISIYTGEPQARVDMPFGCLWPQDEKQGRIPVRLFRQQPWGVNWYGEKHFPANQRMTLNLVVCDDMRALVRHGAVQLGSSGDVSDFCLSLVTTDKTDATIYRATCRPLTREDAREAKLDFPVRELKCDIAEAQKRIASQIDESWGDKPLPGEPFVVSDMEMPMRWIEPGEFTMGTPHEHLPQMGAGRERVRISRGYWIAAYEVTQGQWQRVMNSNPSRITGSPYLPVNNMSWSDARDFCHELTKRERKAGRCPAKLHYRLPTEAEWEYACRCGSEKPFVIPAFEIARRGSRYSSIVEVGTTPPNRWGLYEVLGNVPEWCLDAWADYSGDESKVVVDRYHFGDFLIASFVVRGNGFWINEMGHTCFTRTHRNDIRGGFRGFRVVLAHPAGQSVSESAAVQKKD